MAAPSETSAAGALSLPLRPKPRLTMPTDIPCACSREARNKVNGVFPLPPTVKLPMLMVLIGTRCFAKCQKRVAQVSSRRDRAATREAAPATIARCRPAQLAEPEIFDARPAMDGVRGPALSRRAQSACADASTRCSLRRSTAGCIRARRGLRCVAPRHWRAISRRHERSPRRCSPPARLLPRSTRKRFPVDSRNRDRTSPAR